MLTVQNLERIQRRRDSINQALANQKQKPPTRAQVKAWLKPIRDAINEMRTGEVATMKGYPVTRLHYRDDYVRTDLCINGFVAMLQRVAPQVDITPLEKLSAKLENGVMLVPEDLDNVSACINVCAEALMKCTRGQLIDAAVTEQILIEVEKKGLQCESLE